MRNGTIIESIEPSGTVHEYKSMKIFTLMKI